MDEMTAMYEMAVIDFINKLDFDSDDIPFEVRRYDENPSSQKLIASGESLYRYPAHSGPEIFSLLHSIVIRKDVIVLRIK